MVASGPVNAPSGGALPGASLIGNYCELLASWACLVVLIRRTASRLQPNLAAGGLVLPKKEHRHPAPECRLIVPRSGHAKLGRIVQLLQPTLSLMEGMHSCSTHPQAPQNTRASGTPHHVLTQVTT